MPWLTRFLTAVKILIILFIQFQASAHPCVFVPRFEVHVFNNLPPGRPLLIHCASGNDELGYHNLNVNQSFHWDFCQTIAGTTIFFCHFWWGSKEKTFEVFDALWKDKCSSGFCVWAAKSDGIYFNGDNPTRPATTKVCDWDRRDSHLTACGWAHS